MSSVLFVAAHPRELEMVSTLGMHTAFVERPTEYGDHGDTLAPEQNVDVACAGVDELAAGADAYVQTVIRRDIVEMIPSEMLQDILDYHSSVIDAAQTAARVGAERLVLTHLVPAPPPGQYDDWIARAAEHFGGEIVIGDDLTTVTL